MRVFHTLIILFYPIYNQIKKQLNKMPVGFRRELHALEVHCIIYLMLGIMVLVECK